MALLALIFSVQPVLADTVPADTCRCRTRMRQTHPRLRLSPTWCRSDRAALLLVRLRSQINASGNSNRPTSSTVVTTRRATNGWSKPVDVFARRRMPALDSFFTCQIPASSTKLHFQGRQYRIALIGIIRTRWANRADSVRTTRIGVTARAGCSSYCSETRNR